MRCPSPSLQRLVAVLVAIGLGASTASAQECKTAVAGHSIDAIKLGMSLEQLSARAPLTRDEETSLFSQEGVLVGTDAKGNANELWTTLTERRLCLALDPSSPPQRIDLISAQGTKRELAPGCSYKPTRRPDGFVTLWDCTEAGFQVVSMSTVRVRVFAAGKDPTAKPEPLAARPVSVTPAPSPTAPALVHPPIVAGLDLQPLRMDDAFVVGLLNDGVRTPLNPETKDALSLVLYRLPIAGRCVPGTPAICSNRYALAVSERTQEPKQAVFVLGEVGELEQLKVWTGQAPGTMVLTFAANRYPKPALANEALRQESRGYYVEVSVTGITARPSPTVP